MIRDSLNLRPNDVKKNNPFTAVLPTQNFKAKVNP